MTHQQHFTIEQAARIAETIGIDFARSDFDIEDFRMGMDVELEHGSADERTNVTNDDPAVTGKIAWAHLLEFGDYYRRLAIMETEAEVEGRRPRVGKP